MDLPWCRFTSLVRFERWNQYACRVDRRFDMGQCPLSASSALLALGHLPTSTICDGTERSHCAVFQRPLPRRTHGHRIARCRCHRCDRPRQCRLARKIRPFPSQHRRRGRQRRYHREPVTAAARLTGRIGRGASASFTGRGHKLHPCRSARWDARVSGGPRGVHRQRRRHQRRQARCRRHRGPRPWRRVARGCRPRC